MPTRLSKGVSRDGDRALSAEAIRALSVLCKAHAYATRLGVPTWQFSVSVASLRSQGIDDTDLRFLCAAGLAECRLEQLTPNIQERKFDPLAPQAIADSAYLIATAFGLAYAVEAPTRTPRSGWIEPGKGVATAAASVPTWDYKGTLWWGNRAIKTLRGHAKQQRLALAAFQEARWAHRIDSPLHRDNGTNAKERFRQTVRHLNEHHIFQAIHFWADEEGRGICWGPD